jgi:hypothetical protein
MIAMDRQTLTLIAVVVCMVGLVVMFKELRSAKDDVEGIKGFMMHMRPKVEAPAPAPVPAPPPAPATAEEKAEDN